VARLFPPRRQRERVRGDGAVLRWVAQRGIPAERVVPTLEGEDAVALGEWSVLVTGFVAGAPADRSPATLRRLGDALGRLHALPPPPEATLAAAVGRAGGATPANDLPFGRGCLERVAGRVPPHLAGEYAALRGALAATGDGAGLPQRLSHNDCHLGNALQTAEGEVVLIDWAGSGQWPRVAALGVLLFSCAVQAPGEAPGGGGLAAVEPVLEGYRRHVTLTAAEVAYLPQAVRFRPAVIAARELATAIEAGQTPDAAGWGARYGEAEAVAARASAALAPARP
jgi:Ser/Thr protein kinase RdoA (MazF antagonist)